MLTKHKKKRFSRVLATLLAAMPLLAQAAMESL